MFSKKSIVFFWQKLDWFLVYARFSLGVRSVTARIPLDYARNWTKNHARKMIYARSVLLALEGARSFFRSSSARLENHFLWYRSRSARLENFFARLARARKIYARTQHYWVVLETKYADDKVLSNKKRQYQKDLQIDDKCYLDRRIVETWNAWSFLLMWALYLISEKLEYQKFFLWIDACSI